MVQGVIPSTLILITSLILFFCAYRITKIVTGGFRLDNILFFFMVFYVVYAFIGSAILNIFYVKGGIYYKVYDRKDILFYVYIIISFGLFFIPISVYIFETATGKRVIIQNSLDLRKKDNKLEKNILFFLFIICILVFCVFVKKIGGIPLFRLILHPSLDPSDLRQQVFRGFQGKIWRYEVFYKTIPYILMILTFFSNYKSLRNYLILYNIFIAVIFFEKGPLINLLILFYILYIHKKAKQSNELKNIFAFCFTGVLAIAAILVMYRFFMNNKGTLSSVFLGAMDRIFVVQIVCFPWYFFYAERYGFLEGTSFPNPHGIFPFEYNDLAHNIMVEYRRSNGVEFNEDLAGNMPTVFPADWYTNFGWVGILISFIIFSLIVIIVITFCENQRRKYHDKYAETLYIYFLFYLSKFSGTSFSGIIFDQAWIIPIFIILMLRILKNTKWNIYLKYNIKKKNICL